MRIFSQAAIIDDAVGTGYAVGVGEAFEIQEGWRFINAGYENGSSPDSMVYLQWSNDNATWHDLYLDWVLPKAATAKTKETPVLAQRDLIAFCGSGTAGATLAKVYIVRGYIRVAVSKNTTPGTYDLTVDIN